MSGHVSFYSLELLLELFHLSVIVAGYLLVAVLLLLKVLNALANLVVLLAFGSRRFLGLAELLPEEHVFVSDVGALGLELGNE